MKIGSIHLRLKKMYRNYQNTVRKTITVTDARDVLKMKYAQRRRRISPLNRISVQINKPLNQNFRRSSNTNFNRNKGFVRNNFANRQGLTQNRANRNPGFIVKRNNQGPLQRTIRNGAQVPKNKRVFSNRDGITVVTKTSNMPLLKDEGEDELERMTLADLPGVRIPPGLLSNKMTAQFVSSTPAPLSTSRTTVPASSRLYFPPDTMVADNVSFHHNVDMKPCVLISNLLPSVSDQDIAELFGSVGTLVRIQQLQSGEMMVEYSSINDALSAIEQFNGVALDRQPMHCVLLPGQERSSSLASRLGEKSSGIIPSMSSISSFRQQPSVANKNVKFIVQLP